MKTYTFYLAKQSRGGSMNPVGLNVEYNPREDVRLYPEMVSIPSIDYIVDPRPNKGGRVYIRYTQGEKSIFVDEQRTPFDLEKIREGKVIQEKIQFTSGRRLVEEHDMLLVEYMKACNFNIDTPNRKQTKVSFFEYKPEELSKKAIDREIQEVKLKAKIFGLDNTTLKAVARVTGAFSNSKTIDEIDPSVVMHSLVRYSDMGDAQKQSVEQAIEDKYLISKYVITKSLDNGEILWRHGSPYDLVWKTGGAITTVPQGTEDKISYAAQTLYNAGGQETLNMLRKSCGLAITTAEQVRSENPLLKKAATATESELIDMMLEWNKANGNTFFRFETPFYYYGDVKLGTTAQSGGAGKKGAAEFLLNNKTVFDLASKEFIEKIK